MWTRFKQERRIVQKSTQCIQSGGGGIQGSDLNVYAIEVNCTQIVDVLGVFCLVSILYRR